METNKIPSTVWDHVTLARQSASALSALVQDFRIDLDEESMNALRWTVAKLLEAMIVSTEGERVSRTNIPPDDLRALQEAQAVCWPRDFSRPNRPTAEDDRRQAASQETANRLDKVVVDQSSMRTVIHVEDHQLGYTLHHFHRAVEADDKQIVVNPVHLPGVVEAYKIAKRLILKESSRRNLLDSAIPDLQQRLLLVASTESTGDSDVPF